MRALCRNNPEFVILLQVIVKTGDINLVPCHRIRDSFAAAGAEGHLCFAFAGLSNNVSAFKTPDFHFIHPFVICYWLLFFSSCI